METLTKDTEAYWNVQWKKRTQGGSVEYNIDKFNVICKELAKRPHYAREKILEFGCGHAVYMARLQKIYPAWGHNWTGIDQSEVAVNFVRQGGYNAIKENIYNFSSSEKYGVFLLFDIFEHVDREDLLVDIIRKHANPNGFHIFGNVPLYSSEHDPEEGFERNVDYFVVKKFLAKLGCPFMFHGLYDTYGFPYMWFEGVSEAVVL